MTGSDLNSIESQALPTFKYKGSGLSVVISAALPYVFALAGTILLIFLIYGGLSLMLSRGDPKAISSAQGKITGALIGFIIVFIAYWITSALGLVLGLNQITSIFR